MAKDETEWTAEAMYELGMRHATLEGSGDLEGTMATLVEVPVYEFWPAGKRMVGREAVIRYYRHLIDVQMPRQLGHEMICETFSADALSQEYIVEMPGESRPERHRVLGVLFGSKESPGLLGGERIWGSETFLRQMVGPVWDELETIEDD